jgi:hypothetical protein
MKLSRHLLIISLFLLALPSLSLAKSQIYLDVFMTHHKGVDQGLILTSEIQSLEKLTGRERRILELRNGIRLEIGAEFLKDKKDEHIGPTGEIRLTGTLTGPRGERWLDFRRDGHVVMIGQEHSLQFSDSNSQIVDIKIIPYL